MVQDSETGLVSGLCLFNVNGLKVILVSKLWLIKKLFYNKIPNAFQNLKAASITSNQEYWSTNQNYSHFSELQKQSRVTDNVFSVVIY